MSTFFTENSNTPLAKETLSEDSFPQCSECPIAKLGIYQSAMKSSPATIAGLRTSVTSHKPHRTILHQEQTPEFFGSLRSGWGYAYKSLPDGRRHIQGFLIPGDPVVLDTLHIGPFPISFGVNALTDASVCWFPAESMRLLLLEGEAQRKKTQYWMSYYFASLNHRAAAIAQSDAKGKVAEFLLEMLRRLRRRNLVKGDGYEFLPTQEQIGDCLGLTPVYMSRTLSQLKQRGILEIRDKTLRIFDEHELIAVAERKHG